eukprot:CAMPEP_0117665802 /NCGR_PEP_ID=MMETSP0804-20121206/10017_1 /TAXON_ID=1074897 /ORGANISM="Tetraselmis astigmatica, Strain CCMP880" /LENGTH=44 /DNA_ID= /DNA_START= /DNA_END= /DNA_ORIENTATION=
MRSTSRANGASAGLALLRLHCLVKPGNLQGGAPTARGSRKMLWM